MARRLSRRPQLSGTSRAAPPVKLVNPASARQISDFRATIDKVVNMLAERAVPVTQQGARAFVEYADDGGIKRVNIPHIPDQAELAMLDAIRGYIDHEVAHVLFTDPKQAPFHIPDLRARKDFKALHNTVNILEDTRIEREMQQRFPGSTANMESTCRFVFDKKLKPMLDAKEGHPFEILLMPLMRAWSGQRVAQAFLGEVAANALIAAEMRLLAPFQARVAALSSTQDCTDLAVEILDVLKQAAAPPPPPASGGESKDKDESEPQQGEGDGEDESDKEQKQDESGEDKEQDGKGEENAEQGENQDTPDSDESPESPESQGDDSTENEPNEQGENEKNEESDGDEGEESDDDEGEGSDEGESEAASSEEGESGKAGSRDGDESSDQEGEGDGEDVGADSSGEDGELSDADAEGQELAERVISAMGTAQDGEAAMSEVIVMMLKQTLSPHTYLPFTTDHDLEITVEPESRKLSQIDTAIRETEERMRSTVGQLQAQMRRLFAQQAQEVNYGGRRSGRLQASALHRLMVGDDRVFTRRETHEALDTAITLLIDLSGSMTGADTYGGTPKIQVACETAYVFSQILERLGIAHEIVGFSNTGHEDTAVYEELAREVSAQEIRLGRPFSRWQERLCHYIFKGFDERVTHLVRQRLIGTGRRLSNVECHSNTDGESVLWAAQRLLKRREPRRIMIVLSDGQPASTASGLHQHLKLAVQNCEKMGLEMVGIGIQDSSVRAYYPKAIVITSANELPGTVMTELRRILIEKKPSLSAA